MAEDLDCELLIDLIEERTCLWDLHSNTFKDKHMKAKAGGEGEIADKMVKNFKQQSD